MSGAFPGIANETAAFALMGGSAVGLGRMLGGIVLTIMVCGLAYVSTRFLSRQLGGGPGAVGRPVVDVTHAPAGGTADRPAMDTAGWAGRATIQARRLLALGRRPRRPGRLEIVERLPVGRDRQIMILRVGDQHFLASNGTEGVRFGPPVRLAQEPDAASAFAETLAQAQAAMDISEINGNGIG